MRGHPPLRDRLRPPSTSSPAIADRGPTPSRPTSRPVRWETTCATLDRVILFFGTRRRRRVLGSGTFHCPYCFQPRTYEHAEVRTWIHAFWIPLIPLGGSQEEVQCTVCGGRWAPAVLHAEPLA